MGGYGAPKAITNPLTMRTQHGLGVLGALVREWSLSGSMPTDAKEEHGRWIMSVDAFRELMEEKGLEEGDPADPSSGDYSLRPDVTEVELVQRGEARATILLPETAVMKKLVEQSKDGIPIPLATIYQTLLIAAAYKQPVALPKAIASKQPAAYSITVGGDVFEGFLDPHMAFYTCSQCA